MLSHLSYLLLPLLAPLVILLTLGRGSPYVRHHAAEALNFHIAVTIAEIISVVLVFVLVGLVLAPAVYVAGLVFTVIAALAAGRGQWYRYPVTLRLVR